MSEKLGKKELEMMRQYCAYFGRIGGKSTSEAKRRASQQNAKRAGLIRLQRMGKVVENV